MPYFLIYLAMLAGLVLVTRPLTIFIHEMGHAIPCLLLTGKPVAVYVGTYGDTAKTIRVNLRLIDIHFRYNPFAWKTGLCVPSAKKIKYKIAFIYILTGPLASLVIGGLAIYFSFSEDVHGFWKLFFVVLMGSAIFDFVFNLLPNPHPIQLDDGTLVYNDGQTLKKLVYFMGLPDGYAEGADLYHEGRYLEAADKFEVLAREKPNIKILHQSAVEAYWKARDLPKALECSMRLENLTRLELNDQLFRIHILILMKKWEDALARCEETLLEYPKDPSVLNNMGYTLLALKRYEDAESVLNRAIQVAPGLAFGYNNRGNARIRLGQLDAGLQDVQRSLELDPKNAYAYLSMGLYHLRKKDRTSAMKSFDTAMELDGENPDITEFIKQELDGNDQY